MVEFVKPTDLPSSSATTPAMMTKPGPNKKNDGYPGKLPAGVLSVESWGRTLCTLPKFKTSKLSYAEMAQSTTTEVVQYLKWILENRDAGKGPKVVDLADYLIAVGWRESKAAVLIPGSAEHRVLKD